MSSLEKLGILPIGVTLRDISVVDLAVRHELLDGACACGTFTGPPAEHAAHIGELVISESARIQTYVEAMAPGAGQ